MNETAPANISATRRAVTAVFWWSVVILTLFLVDDIVFGGISASLSALVNPLFATVVAFVVSYLFQVWLTWAGLKEKPGRIARAMLARLMLASRNPQIAQRKESLQHRVATTTTALLVSLAIGGVIPVLLLHKKEMRDAASLRRLALATSAVYAIEFALIYGGYGIGAVVRWLV